MSAKKKIAGKVSPKSNIFVGSTRDYSVTIEMTHVEIGALRKIARQRVLKAISDGDMATFIWEMALLNWDKLEPQIRAIFSYANDEGFNSKSAFIEKTITHKFSLSGASLAKLKKGAA